MTHIVDNAIADDMPLAQRIQLFRNILRNNRLPRMDLWVATDETFLPAVLSGMGFWPSNNQVRKNRPELWRTVVAGEVIRIGRIDLTILLEVPCSGEHLS